jgi:hypothetical protein
LARPWKGPLFHGLVDGLVQSHLQSQGDAPPKIKEAIRDTPQKIASRAQFDPSKLMEGN